MFCEKNIIFFVLNTTKHLLKYRLKKIALSDHLHYTLQKSPSSKPISIIGIILAFST